jgi:ribosomal-protein-alanine N-acetyltransferase
LAIDYGYGVQLGPIAMEHAEQLREWRNDPRVRDWCRQCGLISELDQEAWVKAQNADPTIEMFTINAEKVGLSGVCGLTSIDMLNRRAEFSLYVGPNKQGNGTGEKALRTLCRFGFEELGLECIWGESFEGNPATSIFEHVGFKHEGTRRNFYFKKGKFINANLYSILREEFKA